jgi:hypothetical protein
VPRLRISGAIPTFPHIGLHGVEKEKKTLPFTFLAIANRSEK